MIISDNDILLELFVKGVYVEGESNRYLDLKNRGLERYKRFDFSLNKYRYSTYMEEVGLTPFHYIDGKLYYDTDLLENIKISRIEGYEWGSEDSWYFKFWNNTANDPYELRLNPINNCSNLRFVTGENGEFRGCAFCHRVYTHSRKGDEHKIKSVQNIFDKIIEKEGSRIFKIIKKVLIMTGNMNNSKDLLALCHETYELLKKEKFDGVFSISTNQIFAENDIKELAEIDNTIFDYTLEIFERRKCLMGIQKGYEINSVIEALEVAKKYFQFIRITYIVGLDSYEALEKGFLKLKKLELVDDVIPLIFVPYTPEMKKLRNIEANEIEYYKKVREFFKNNGLIPLKNGLSKNLFLEDRLNNRTMDGLLEMRK